MELEIILNSCLKGQLIFQALCVLFYCTILLIKKKHVLSLEC